jgi:3-dehydroquinate dehydratase
MGNCLILETNRRIQSGKTFICSGNTYHKALAKLVSDLKEKYGDVDVRALILRSNPESATPKFNEDIDHKTPIIYYLVLSDHKKLIVRFRKLSNTYEAMVKV